MSKPVCVIAGVGEGNGAALARAFSDEGIKPADMAASAVWLARQPRSAWTFEIEVRPFGEKW